MNFSESYNYFLRNTFSNLRYKSDQDFLKAKISIASLINLIILNIVYVIVFYEKQNYLLLSISNMLVWSITLWLVFRATDMDIVFKILTIYGCISTSFHSYLGGGLYSSFNLWFLIISLGMSIFFNRVYSVIASVYSMLTVSFFFYLQLSGKVDFKKELETIPVVYDYTNLMCVLIMLSITLFFFFSKENIDLLWKKQKEDQIDNLEYLLKERTAEIVRMRTEMAREFHDEMGNKLALISTYINVVQLQNMEGNPKLAEYLQKINQNAKAVYEGTRDFIWTIEAEHANFYELGVYIRDFGERMFLPMDVDFITGELSQNLKKVSTTFTENHQIILIAKEAMTNALKHSGSKKIELKLEQNAEDTVDMYIKDYGKGFNEKDLVRVNGIKNMKSRAHKIGAELFVTTHINKGTFVHLRYKITLNG